MAGPGPIPPSEIIGRDPMDLPTLIKEIHKAKWPAFVKLAPEDFAFVAPIAGAAMGSITKADEKTGFPFFMIGPTKVQSKEVKGVLDLTDWQPTGPPLIEVPASWGRA